MTFLIVDIKSLSSVLEVALAESNARLLGQTFTLHHKNFTLSRHPPLFAFPEQLSIKKFTFVALTMNNKIDRNYCLDDTLYGTELKSPIH